MKELYPDPDFEGFDGIYSGKKGIKELPPNEYNFHALISYLNNAGKTFNDLSNEEKEKFKLSKPSE